MRPVFRSARQVRWRADSWSPDEFDVAEWVCRPHPWDFSLEGVLSMLHLWSDVDPATQKVIAYHGHINQLEQETTIWMDGRPHPPEHAPHTWSGFSTGEWDGDTLVVTTTHVKESYIRRVGSDAQRSIDDPDAMEAHGRSPSGNRHHLRSDVSRGTVHPQHHDVADWIQRCGWSRIRVKRPTETARASRHGRRISFPAPVRCRAWIRSLPTSSARRISRGSAVPRRCTRSTSRR